MDRQQRIQAAILSLALEALLLVTLVSVFAFLGYLLAEEIGPGAPMNLRGRVQGMGHVFYELAFLSSIFTLLVGRKTWQRLNRQILPN